MFKIFMLSVTKKLDFDTILQSKVAPSTALGVINPNWYSTINFFNFQIGTPDSPDFSGGNLIHF